MKSSKFKIRSIIAAFVVTSFLSSFYPFENSNAYADEYDTYEYSFSATPSESINLGESINLKAYENDALEYSFLAEKGNEVKTLNDNISIASFNKLKIYTDKDSIIEQYVKNNNFDYIINGQDYKNNNSNKEGDNSNILLLMAALILTLPILIKRKNILKKYK